MESAFVNNPLILLGFIVSLALCGFGLAKKTHFCVTAISALNSPHFLQ